MDVVAPWDRVDVTVRWDPDRTDPTVAIIEWDRAVVVTVQWIADVVGVTIIAWDRWEVAAV